MLYFKNSVEKKSFWGNGGSIDKLNIVCTVPRLKPSKEQNISHAWRAFQLILSSMFIFVANCQFEDSVFQSDLTGEVIS